MKLPAPFLLFVCSSAQILCHALVVTSSSKSPRGVLRNVNYERSPYPLYSVTNESNDSRCDSSTSSSSNNSNSNSNLSNLTSLFNNDIHRIASRTKSKGSNFNPIHAAEHAERMLLQMISMHVSSGGKTARPNIESFKIVLMGYANIRGCRWKKRDDNDNHLSFGYSSSALTNEWGDEYMEKLKQDINESKKTLDDQGEYKRNHEKARPQEQAAICAADRVDFIIEQLHELQTSEQEAGIDIKSLELDTDFCNLCLLIYARCTYPQNIANDIYHTKHDDISKDLNYFPALHTGSFAERSERLIKYMLYLSKQPGEPERNKVQPNAQSFSYLIWALSRQQHDARGRGQQRQSRDNEIWNNQHAIRANEWLSHLESLYNDCKVETGEYTHEKRLLRKYLIMGYSDILTAWSKCSAKKSPRKVYKFMTLIENLCEEDKMDIEKTLRPFSDEYDCDEHNADSKVHDKEMFTGTWSNSTDPPFIEQYAPKLDPTIPLYPSSQCYTTTILSLSKSKELGSAQRADRLLFKMLDIYDSGKWGRNKPEIYAINGVISAWANCASSAVGNADKAERLLDLMEKLYFEKDKPEYDHLIPDRITYNTVIKAWTNCREDAAILKAESVMERMEQRYNSIGDEFLDVKPDSYTYNTMITGWLRSELNFSAENAESLLRKMVEKYLHGDKDLEPSQKIFSYIIDKWAKSDRRKNVAVTRSLDLLHLMESLYDQGCTRLKPDKITYTSIIDAIARSRSPKGAKMALPLLETMERKYSEGDYHVKPSVQTYSCVLLSLLKSDISDKHLLAQEIPKRMNAIGVKPNAFTWNYVIHVTTNVDGDDGKKVEAFKVALGAFQSLRKSTDYNTDSYTFAFFLKAIKHLMPDSVMRSSIAKEAFSECIKEGKMNDQVLSRLVWVLPQEELRDVVGSVRVSDIRNIKARDLPLEWGYNAMK